MPTPPIQWADAPQHNPRKWFKIVSVKPKQPFTALIVNERCVGVYTHYMPPCSAGEKPRTQPCLGAVLACPGCTLKRSRRWKGYIGCWSRRYNEYLIAEVTSDAVRACPSLVSAAVNLRGQILELQRMGDKHNSPVMAWLKKPEGEVYTPAPLDVHAQLARLWGFEKMGWAGNDGTSATGPMRPQPVEYRPEEDDQIS